MTDSAAKPIAEGSNMAVETTTIAPETENPIGQGDEAPASEEDAAAQLGDFA